MNHIYMSPLGAKAQVTLPKAVRKALGIREKEDMVGFLVDGKRIALTRIEPVPSSNPFTEDEWKKIETLAARLPAAVFSDSKKSLRHLKKKLKKGTK